MALFFRPKRLLTMTIVSAMLFITTLVVYYSGGASSASTNFYFIPIIVTALYLGLVDSILIAIAAALLCGPYMPASVEGHVRQSIADMLVRTCFFYVIAVISAQLSGRVKEKAAEFFTLYQGGKVINSTLDLKEVLQRIAEMATRVSGAKACTIRLLNGGNGELQISGTYGLSQQYLSKGPVILERSPMDRDVLKGRPVTIYDAASDPRFQYPEEARREGIKSVLCLPLVNKERILGVLRVYTARPHRFREHDIDLLSAFAEEAAIAIENAKLYERLYQAYLETVRSLALAVEAKDPQLLGHSERVAEWSSSIAGELGLGDEDRRMIRYGAILHDIGKIGMEEDILFKVGQELSEGERMLMEMHPLVGKSIIEAVEFLKPTVPMIRHQRERVDGLGYPDRLAGEEIPISARILAVANAFDMLTSSSVGNGALPAELALREIESKAGSQFDPKVVIALAKVLEMKKAEAVGS